MEYLLHFLAVLCLISPVLHHNLHSWRALTLLSVHLICVAEMPHHCCLFFSQAACLSEHALGCCVSKHPHLSPSSRQRL